MGTFYIWISSYKVISKGVYSVVLHLNAFQLMESIHQGLNNILEYRYRYTEKTSNKHYVIENSLTKESVCLKELQTVFDLMQESWNPATIASSYIQKRFRDLKRKRKLGDWVILYSFKKSKSEAR